MKKTGFTFWHTLCISQKYNGFIVYVNSVCTGTEGNGNKYSDWGGNGNKSRND